MLQNQIFGLFFFIRQPLEMMLEEQYQDMS